MTRNNDVYKKDREQLNNILLTSTDIWGDSNAILSLVPELYVCERCEQNSPSHDYMVYGHIKQTVNLIEKDLLLKVSALFHDIGKPYKKYSENDSDRFTGHWTTSVVLADLALHRLGYGSKFISNVCTLVKYHDYLVPQTKEGVSSLSELIGQDLLPYLLKLKKADLSAHSKAYFNTKMDVLNKIIQVYNKEFAQSDSYKINLLTSHSM